MISSDGTGYVRTLEATLNWSLWRVWNKEVTSSDFYFNEKQTEVIEKNRLKWGQGGDRKTS